MKEKKLDFRREELEMLPTAELDRLLRAQLVSDSPDRDSVLLLMNILETRDPTLPSNRPADMDIFREKLQKARAQTSDPVPAPRRKKAGRWLAIAAVLALVLLVAVPRIVFAESIFDLIGHWTQQIFCFLQPCEESPAQTEYVFHTDHPGLQQLYDTVSQYGVTEPVVPTWLPEGYELVLLDVIDQKISTKIVARYKTSDRYIVITYEIYNDRYSNKFLKDEADTIIFEWAGKEHYIIENENKWNAVWSTDKTECFIMLNDTEEVLRKIVKAVYTEVTN